MNRRNDVPSKSVFSGLIALAFLFAGQCALAQDTGLIQGKVTDPSGSPILGAVVTVQGADGNSRTTVTDAEGAFRISSLAPGNYRVKISASGMSDWSDANLAVSVPSESKPVLAVLQVAPAVTSVTVGLPPEEVAQEQLDQEVKQRAFGVLPNFYVAFTDNPAPLSPKQKLHLGLKVLLDPATIAAVGITAGIQQKRNSYYQYGQGSKGFAKRFGAEYATAADAVLITSVLANSVLHQDPRYFYSGKGTTAQRAWYAVKSAFRAKGDNGKWQPPYSGLIGSIAAAEISQTYHPGSRTQYTLIGRSLMFRFAGLVALNLAEELFLKTLTTRTREDQSAANVVVLREGTPVPLIAIDGFRKEGAAAGQTITFVLAEDLTVGGQTLAKRGDIASGQVSQGSAAKAPGEPMRVVLERVTLHAGSVSVPLRSSPVRGVLNPMQYKELRDSDKLEVTLFVAENVQFRESQ